MTCCGQPALNSGFWLRAVAEGVLAAYQDAEMVVVASGSCAAMLKVFYPQIFQDTPGTKPRWRRKHRSFPIFWLQIQVSRI